MALIVSQSGFDREKFVDCKDELEEFLCAICQGIFRDPKVTQCCGQTYCHSDITQWLDTHNSCPNCRKRLEMSELLDPPKALKNLWSKLKIKCDYTELGCNETVQLEDLSVHLIQCGFRPNIECKVCGIVRASAKDHNCVDSLKKANEALKLKQTKDLDMFGRKYRKMEETLKERFVKDLEVFKNEVFYQMGKNGKTIRTMFTKFEKKWDINDQTSTSKNKRSLPDNDLIRPKKRLIVSLRRDSESGASDNQSNSENEGTEEESPEEEPTDVSDEEQEESDEDLLESDS